MVQHNKQMPLRDSIYIRTLKQKCGVTVYHVLHNPRKYPVLSQYPKSTLYRHAKKTLDADEQDGRSHNQGRPRKVTARTQRMIKRQIKALRKSVGTFSTPLLQTSCGLTDEMSNSTFRRALKKLGYNWRNTRRKGKLLPRDLKRRVEFCRKMDRLALNTPDFWCQGIALYVDAVGFEYKSNPYEHAKSLGAKEWRMKSEGLDMDCTAKGSKEGKTTCQFMVGMTYERGVVLCVPMTSRINGRYFAQLIKNDITEALRQSGKASKRILQDGDPSQNSKIARDELFKQNIRLFSIPPRSPDLNPIENLFNQVRRTIKEDSLQRQLERESRAQFVTRVCGLLLNFNPTRIDNLIKSMPKRIELVKKSKGLRIKY